MTPNQSLDVYYDYLYTINPIAERIRKDVNATKEAYQSLWDGLTFDEQNKILEESIISPETVLKYSKYKKTEVSTFISFPYYKNNRLVSTYYYNIIHLYQISRTFLR